jgi:hypothetical protein
MVLAEFLALLGWHHRRRTPDLVTPDLKRGHAESDAVSLTLRDEKASRIEQLVEIDFEDSGNLAIGCDEPRLLIDLCDDRVQSKAADWNIERRQTAEYVNSCDVQRHFLVSLAERRLLERFSGFDGAAR